MVNRLLEVNVTVTNTGKVAGAEVVQVYLGIPVQGQPPKRLVGFQKVYLEPNESREVTITIDPMATNHPMGVWDYYEHDFVVSLVSILYILAHLAKIHLTKAL